MTNITEDIERQGIYKCAAIFTQLGFMFREQSVGDYGIDAIIEPKEKDYLSGKLIAVQIKSGDSYFNETKGNTVVFRGDIKHYNYWINHSLPVIIVLYSPSKDKCIWEVVNKQTAIKGKKGWKVNIPYNQILENSMKQLQDLANNQNNHQRRWNSLVIAKEWMLETKEHGESILEVEEWINKSSGRGKFTLKVKENEKEKILFERTMLGFGTKSYEQVIQELFPWASIEIDEEFYEKNCYYETLDDESLSVMLDNGIELQKSYNSINKIYPYTNVAGEVDFYRLKLTLNQIGKAFIEMENFLDTGKFYLINK